MTKTAMADGAAKAITADVLACPLARVRRRFGTGRAAAGTAPAASNGSLSLSFSRLLGDSPVVPKRVAAAMRWQHVCLGPCRHLQKAQRTPVGRPKRDPPAPLAVAAMPRMQLTAHVARQLALLKRGDVTGVGQGRGITERAVTG